MADALMAAVALKAVVGVELAANNYFSPDLICSRVRRASP